MQNACRQCKYFRKAVDLNNVASTTGICLRYPPKPFPVPQQGQIAMLSARPNVESGDFCGEFVSNLAFPPQE